MINRVTLSVVALLMVLHGATAEIRCTQGTVGSTCPDVAPVCCFIGDKFTLGCCRPDEVCKAHGCAPAPKINTSYTTLTDSEVEIHFTATELITFVSVVILILLGIFFLVCGGSQASRRLAELRVRRAEARARAAEPNSDDDAVNSDEEKNFRSELEMRKHKETPRSEAAVTDAETNKKEEGRNNDDEPESEEEEEDGDESKGLLTNKETKKDDRAEDTPPPSTTAVSIADATSSTCAPDVTSSSIGLCEVCHTAKVDCLLLDCNHSTTCHSCAKHLKYCPECKKKIRRRKHIFL